MENNVIGIDCTPIPELYDYRTINTIVCWSIVTLIEKQESKWYNKLNPFRHNYLEDYHILKSIMNKETKNIN